MKEKIETCTEILSKKVIAQASCLESLFHTARVDSDALVLFAFCSVDVFDPLQFWISHVGLVLFRVQPALVLIIVEKG